MLRTLVQRALVVTRLVDRLQPVALLALRLYVSSVFFRSGIVKISDWGATLALFHDEYKVPLLPPDVAACVGAFGELTFPVLITLGLVMWGTRQQAWFFGLSVGGAMALNLLVKVLFARPRPALWLSLKPAFYYSFPSGHAMGAAAMATALGFLLWQHRGQGLTWTLGPLFALGVGWSRVYLGVHYPSDVLAGWTGSVGWVAGLHVLFSPEFHELRRLWREALHRRLPTLVSAPRQATGPAV